MIDRRILLASVASLLGLAAFRWLRGSPATYIWVMNRSKR